MMSADDFDDVPPEPIERFTALPQSANMPVDLAADLPTNSPPVESVVEPLATRVDDPDVAAPAQRLASIDPVILDSAASPAAPPAAAAMDTSSVDEKPAKPKRKSAAGPRRRKSPAAPSPPAAIPLTEFSESGGLADSAETPASLARPSQEPAADISRPSWTRRQLARFGRWLTGWATRQREQAAARPVSAPALLSRARWVVTAVGLFWCLLTVRLLQLQLWDRPHFEALAERQRSAVDQIAARPGEILDRSGRLLATSVARSSLYIVPSRISDPTDFATRLANIVDRDPVALAALIGRNATQHFLWIQRRMTPERVDWVRSLQLPPGTYGFREEYERVYPQGAIASHVLGLRDVDGQGQGGIEQTFHDQIAGSPGTLAVVRDARGRVIAVRDEEVRAPAPGQSVVLTIDSVLQLQLEQELDQVMDAWRPQSCCAMAVVPQTGEILALGSRPAFDPSDLAAADPEAWKNRVISDIYEPGSTFKPFVVAYGLDEGLIAADEVWDCERGEYRMGRRVLHDHHHYGKLNLVDVLVKSSNIGMAKVGERIGNAGLYDAACRFGFGQRTGIELPGELPGLLRPLSQWNDYSTGSIPMGHEVAATPLQVAMATAALANHGQAVRPRIVRQLLAAGGTIEPYEPDAIRRTCVSAETAQWVVREPMTQVIVRGTGKRAQLRGYAVFGKTGTAQTLDPNGGYREGHYLSSFVCGAPAEDPAVIVLVVVSEASIGKEAFGGKVAAPAAARILKHALTSLQIPAYEPPTARTAAQPNPEPRR